MSERWWKITKEIDMKKLLITFLVLFSTNAYCEWTVVDLDKDGNGYMDFSTIKRSSTSVRVWELLDFKNTQSLGSIYYNSIVSFREYDCSQDRVRSLSSTYFSNTMGSGNPMKQLNQPSDWMYVLPKTVGAKKLNILCK